MNNFLIFQLTLAMVYAIAILGLNLLTGFNGQFSLGHGAFFAIGAYTAAILMDRFDIAYYWTLPAAGVVCFVPASCSACRRCGSRASISRSRPSRSPSRRRRS